MNIKLSEIKAPALAGVIKESGVRAALAEIKNCEMDGATMVDLHMSCLDEPSEENLKEIIGASGLPILALNYNIDNSLAHRGYSEDDRAEIFLRAARAGAAGIDMQGYTFHLPSKTEFCGENKYSFTRDNPREVVTDSEIIAKQCDFIERIHALGTEVLLSCHPGVTMNAEQVVELALFHEQRNPDIIKIVTVAKDDEDAAEAIRAMTLLKREVKTPVAYHASGAAGLPTRVINALLGGQIAFCIDRYKENSDRQQLDLKAMRAILDNYRRII
ncbi:MAG: type I 3-dehydroquinate dehydratase [Clostridia bacterium]|nr:type I 3-dehydroquinate dehydratase [Clostridia bacterium]